MKIKIFTDIQKAKEAPKWEYVFPLVELLVKENLAISECYEIVEDIQQADFVALALSVIYLFENNQKEYFYKYLNLAKSNNKKMLIFAGGDYGKTIADSSIISIRLGGFKSKFPENTFIMPPFIEDPVEKMNLKFYDLDLTSNPTIGFVGHSAGGLKKWSKEFLIFLKGNLQRLIGKKTTDFQRFYPSSIKRFQYLISLKDEPELITDFIFRARYRAGNQTGEDRVRTTREFYDNIQRNLYTFCLRGGGNFSVRFYETLAMGRIPILLDTDCQLPFEDAINWSNHCLIVNESDSKRIAQKILDFHQSLTPEKSKQMQKENRKIWVKYLNKESYFLGFKRELQKYI